MQAGVRWRKPACDILKARESHEAHRIGCTIALVSTGPQLIRPQAAQERNWLPMIVAAVIVLAIAIGLVLYYEHGKSAPAVTPISAALDPYAGNLPISNLHMSESANLAGGKVTYLDGRIANNGNRVVAGITVQVLFRDPAHCGSTFQDGCAGRRHAC